MTSPRSQSNLSSRLRTSTAKVSQVASRAAQTAKRTAKRASTATKKAVSKTTKQVISKSQKVVSKSKQLTAKASARAKSARARSSKKTTSAQHQPLRLKRTPLTWREGTLLSIIGVCALMIGISIFVGTYYNPETYAQNELEKLAKSYYIEYLYPQMLGKNIDQPEKVLAKYADSGIASIALRQFLLYNDGKHYSSLSIFQNTAYKCSLSKTFVRYYPVEPYGPRDFRAQYYPSCEAL